MIISRTNIYFFSMFSLFEICLCTSHLYREGWGKAWLKCGAITFQVPPQCRGNDWVLTLGSLPKGNFLLRRVGKDQSFDLQFAP